MVYISDDGKILQTPPWGLRKIYSFFSGFIFVIVMFFRTLFWGDVSNSRSGYTRDHRPGFGPPGPSNRRLGRPDNTKNTVNIPFGGCSSCMR